MIDLTRLDQDTRAVHAAHGFDTLPFAELAAALVARGHDPERNRLRVRVEPPPPEAVNPLPSPGTTEHDRCRALGAQAIAAGQVGAIVLNGGMATRFGGTVKGAVPAVDGRSFLDLKIAQVARAGQGRTPVLLMNSFATDQATARHLTGLTPGCPVRAFSQMVSLRLTPAGELFNEADGRPSLHAPGHGDLPFALRRSGELDRFREQGGRWLTVSNVDNLGAGLDPVVIGQHIASGRPMTVELVEKVPGDAGGVPALVDGRMTIVESFRMPRDFDGDAIPVFNTNTFVFDAAALATTPELDWFMVQKTVDGRPAIQFERLVGQLSDFIDAHWLLVPRAGAASRFVPIKVPQDLVTQADNLRALLSAQGVL